MPVVRSLSGDPFEEFFQDHLYLEAKRSLYNYLRRRDEIARFLPGSAGTVLEIGSGTAPVTPPDRGTIYSDASHQAMKYLAAVDGVPKTVVLSATEIPFANDSIQTVVCSEVLEHIDDDRLALSEMYRVLGEDGELILTVPLHQYYFALDDRFVHHRRRYAIAGLVRLLQSAGFSSITLSKVAGPLEKVTAMAAVTVFRIAAPLFAGGNSRLKPFLKYALPVYAGINRLYARLIRLDAKLMPWALSTVILAHCKKIPAQST